MTISTNHDMHPCMKGSIWYDKTKKRYYVCWYDSTIRRTRKIGYYKGLRMDAKSLADKLLASMQGDMENWVSGCQSNPPASTVDRDLQGRVELFGNYGGEYESNCYER